MFYVCSAFLLFTAIVKGVDINYDDKTIVTTNAGSISGIRATDGNYTLFMGIPYAKVDEDNPFGPAVPYPKFEDVFEAHYDSAICPQREEFNNTIVGTLDCLQLNVYVPDSASASNPLPVLVWIYGGGMTIGFANRYLYGPSYLVRHDVILVTINYRLGPYGFMCLNTPEVPGNQGLKDQLLALRWIKENIDFFGGDATKITAFGQSAGSLSIHSHLLSPHEDLFHQVIMHSGSAYIISLIVEPDRTVPIRMAEWLGFTTADLNEALRFISQANTNDVIQAGFEINGNFRPCVEPDHLDVDRFVTDYPINQDVPKIRGKSVLIGYTNDETIGVYANRPAESFPQITIFEDFLQQSFNFDPEYLTRITSITRNFYLGGQNLSRDVMYNIANFHSDFTFLYPTDKCIASFLENGAEKLYYFKFSYVGERNFVRRTQNISADIGGAAHTDEISYLFDMEHIPEEPNPDDRLMIDRMTLMWTNFVKYGDPTPELSPLLPIKWEPVVNISSYPYLDLDSNLTTGTNPFHERISFWELLFYTQREYQIGFRDENSGASLLSYRMYFVVITMLSMFFNM